MHVFELLVILHVVFGLAGLVAFWVPIVTRKGAPAHRKWGRIACYGFIGGGVLAIAMALLSLYGPEERLPMITDRVLFDGLFGWMMLYLGLLTLNFAGYGLASVKHRTNRAALRTPGYQIAFVIVTIGALNCWFYGYAIDQPLMMMVALIGMVAMGTQLYAIWRKTSPPKAYIGEHFRALLGMGISAYTAFLSVGLIRLIPEQVFNPLIWIWPSVVGIVMIIYFTVQANRKLMRVKTPQTAISEREAP